MVNVVGLVFPVGRLPPARFIADGICYFFPYCLKDQFSVFHILIGIRYPVRFYPNLRTYILLWSVPPEPGSHPHKKVYIP